MWQLTGAQRGGGGRGSCERVGIAAKSGIAGDGFGKMHNGSGRDDAIVIKDNG